jgi:hypothetical protein
MFGTQVEAKAETDDGGSKDLWNVGTTLPDYTVLQPRRQPSSWHRKCLRIKLGGCQAYGHPYD